METQNITLSIRKDLLKKARLIAVEHQTSLSGLLANYLEQIVTEEADYNEARTRQMQQMERGYDFGTAGSIIMDRESLHAR